MEKLFKKDSWQNEFIKSISPSILPNFGDTHNKTAMMEQWRRTITGGLGMSSDNLGDGLSIGNTFPKAEAIARTFPAEQLTNGDLSKNGHLVRHSIVDSRSAEEAQLVQTIEKRKGMVG